MKAPLRLTLDWNCVIEVEQLGEQAQFVNALVAAHRQGHVETALLAASASENNRSRRFPGNAILFTDRIEKLGWSDLPLVPMPGVFGLSYWDFCYFVDDGPRFDAEVSVLWRLIASNIAEDISAHLPLGQTLEEVGIQSEALAKWRNAWCDVISAYCHIHEGRDVFVTNNTSDFQRNAERLAELGMERIKTPREAFTLICS